MVSAYIASQPTVTLSSSDRLLTLPSCEEAIRHNHHFVVHFRTPHHRHIESNASIRFRN